MGRKPRISRDQLLDAARAEFVARGYDGTTLADVGRHLGVTPAAILRHFPSKQELFATAMAVAPTEPLFLDQLARTSGSADPRKVLREFAEQVIPFIASVVGPAIAMQMHIASRQTTVVVPFAASDETNPPRRALRTLTDYFTRATKAGVIRGDSPPRALALLFMGQLQSYVLMHEVLKVTPVLPLETYLDALIDLWIHGGICARKETKAPRESNPGGARPRRRRSDSVVDARPAAAEAARPRRNAGGANGERRVARRRPRHERPRR